MKSKSKTARAVLPNRGIEAAYKRRLMSIIDRMAANIEWFVAAQYRKAPPRMVGEVELAQDAARAPAQAMQIRLGELRDQWQEEFDQAAEDVATGYVTRMAKHADNAFMAALKDAGWAIKFEMTPAVRDVLSASIGENIGLIKSIPAEFLGRVEGIVMRGYTAGRDLQYITTELRALQPMTARRAALIARDQCNKANAVVNRARQLELGITRAVWMHSGAGKEPRPGHVQAGKEKREYNIAEGCPIDGEMIQPGTLINCRCSARPVLPF